MNKKIVLAIGRWMPIHLGHKKFLVDLAKQYDKLIIGIGSCYENGTARNCIPAVEREKLLRKILKTEGIPDEKIKIVPVEDRETFEEWIDDVSRICKDNGVTHFCTGNKEDILNVLEEKGINLNLEMINPENNSNFPYHATDVRNAIINGETDKLDEMIPQEIKDTVIKNISKEIVVASKGEGKKFIPGRQTVDTVFLVKDKKDSKTYVLIGKRDKSKIDFPGINAIPGGGIKEFESPIDATTRTLFDETGIKVEIIDNSDEPAKVMLPQLSNIEQQMNYTGIYASPDNRVNGTLGGGSQCFSILIDGDINKIKEILHSSHDLENLEFVDINDLKSMTLAYEQKTMVYDTLNQLGIDYEKEEQLAVLNESGESTGEGVSRKKAHQEGILHGASHTYIYKVDENNRINILLQRRSANKDSFPNRLDISSAGHMEAGMDFRTTAQKELQEELGLEVEDNELEEIFKQRFSNISESNGKIFNNQEFNTIYLLKKDLDVSKLHLQEEELSEVLWMDADEISRRLENNDEELCIDKQEYSKVLKKIKEKENIMEESKLELKDIYDDAILEGQIKGAKLTKRFQGRIRKDNTSGILMESMSGRIAGSLAREAGGDEIVAKGISTALQSSIIAYGKVGEEFFRTKLAPKGIEFSQREYSKRCAESILSGYKGKRATKIIEGVLAAIDNDPNNIEANSAKAGIMINEYMVGLKTKSEEKVRDDYNSGRVIDVESIFNRLDEMNYDNVSNEEKMRRLEIAYKFIEKNKDKINFDRVRKCFPNIRGEELVAYYVANLDEVELGRALKLAEKEDKEHTID